MDEKYIKRGITVMMHGFNITPEEAQHRFEHDSKFKEYALYAGEMQERYEKIYPQFFNK